MAEEQGGIALIESLGESLPGFGAHLGQLRVDLRGGDRALRDVDQFEAVPGPKKPDGGLWGSRDRI